MQRFFVPILFVIAAIFAAFSYWKRLNNSLKPVISRTPNLKRVVDMLSANSVEFSVSIPPGSHAPGSTPATLSINIDSPGYLKLSKDMKWAKFLQDVANPSIHPSGVLDASDSTILEISSIF